MSITSDSKNMIMNNENTEFQMSRRGEPADSGRLADGNASAKVLSSILTPVLKFAVPAIFLAILPVWIWGAPARTAWFPCAIWAIICVVLLWWAIPIKKVVLAADGFLFVSNYRRKITIPVSDIEKIEESHGGRYLSTISIYIRQATRFGRHIRIIAPLDLSEDDFLQIVETLRLAANGDKISEITK